MLIFYFLLHIKTRFTIKVGENWELWFLGLNPEYSWQKKIKKIRNDLIIQLLTQTHVPAHSTNCFLFKMQKLKPMQVFFVQSFMTQICNIYICVLEMCLNFMLDQQYFRMQEWQDRTHFSGIDLSWTILFSRSTNLTGFLENQISIRSLKLWISWG